MNTLPTTSHTYETETPSEQTGLIAAVDLVHSFTDDPLFMAGLERRGADDETDREYAQFLAEYVEDYLTVYGDEMVPRTRQEVQLAGETPLMIHVSSEIAHLEAKKAKTHHLPSEEWNRLQSLKPFAVDYNHLLSGYMSETDDVRFSELTKGLVESALPSFPGHDKQVAQMIVDIARGARNEVASQQLIRGAGVPFENTTNAGDLKGADGYLVDGSERYKIDFKASMGEIVRLNDGNETLPFAIKQHRQDASILYYSAITDDMYQDKCRLSDETVAQRAPVMAIYLQRAVIAMRGLQTTS